MSIAHGEYPTSRMWNLLDVLRGLLALEPELTTDLGMSAAGDFHVGELPPTMNWPQIVVAPVDETFDDESRTPTAYYNEAIYTVEVSCVNAGPDPETVAKDLFWMAEVVKNVARLNRSWSGNALTTIVDGVTYPEFELEEDENYRQTAIVRLSIHLDELDS